MFQTHKVLQPYFRSCVRTDSKPCREFAISRAASRTATTSDPLMSGRWPYSKLGIQMDEKSSKLVPSPRWTFIPKSSCVRRKRNVSYGFCAINAGTVSQRACRSPKLPAAEEDRRKGAIVSRSHLWIARPGRFSAGAPPGQVPKRCWPRCQPPVFHHVRDSLREKHIETHLLSDPLCFSARNLSGKRRRHRERGFKRVLMDSSIVAHWNLKGTRPSLTSSGRRSAIRTR